MESTPKHPGIAARLEAFIADKADNPRQFALAAGMTPQVISHLLQGKAVPSGDTLTALVTKWPLLNTTWLLTGRGMMYLNSEAAAPPTTAPTPGLTSGAATVAEAENVLLRELLTSKNTVIELLRSEVTELRGKSPDSSDAAGPLATYPPKPHVPVTGFQLAVQRRARGAGQMSR